MSWYLIIWTVCTFANHCPGAEQWSSSKQLTEQHCQFLAASINYEAAKNRQAADVVAWCVEK